MLPSSVGSGAIRFLRENQNDRCCVGGDSEGPSGFAN